MIPELQFFIKELKNEKSAKQNQNKIFLTTISRDPNSVYKTGY